MGKKWREKKEGIPALFSLLSGKTKRAFLKPLVDTYFFFSLAETDGIATPSCKGARDKAGLGTLTCQKNYRFVLDKENETRYSVCAPGYV